jgi:hypothetical protein
MRIGHNQPESQYIINTSSAVMRNGWLISYQQPSENNVLS